jgi:hypothetical protein
MECGNVNKTGVKKYLLIGERELFPFVPFIFIKKKENNKQISI